MAVDITLKIEGLDGESQVLDHEGEIDVLDWSWGMANSADMHSGAGGGSGRVDVQDLAITKYVDKASVNLVRKCCDGRHFEEATLSVRKSGENPVEYLKLVMKPVIVTSVSSGGGGGDDRLMENVTLTFGKFEFIYTPQKEDGTPEAELGIQFNIETNAEV